MKWELKSFDDVGKDITDFEEQCEKVLAAVGIASKAVLSMDMFIDPVTSDIDATIIYCDEEGSAMRCLISHRSEKKEG